MDTKNVNISSVEIFFDKWIRNVSKNVFYTSFPKAIQKSWKDIVIVDIAGGIEDMNAYGSGVVNVFLYSRAMSNGQKPVGSLKALEDKLDMALGNVSEANFSVTKLRTFSDYDSDRDMFCNIVALKIMIV